MKIAVLSLVVLLTLGVTPSAYPKEPSDRELRQQSIRCGCVVKLESTDGVKYYAVGPGRTNTAETATDGSTIAKSAPSSLQTTLKEIFIEFANIWSSEKVNELTQEELNRADALVTTYVATLSFDPSADFNAKRLAARGNRYFPLLMPLLPTLPPNTQTLFWREYIESEVAREEDRPDDRQKIMAIQELHKLLTRSVYADFYLTEDVSREILRLTPKIHEAIMEVLSKPKEVQ